MTDEKNNENGYLVFLRGVPAPMSFRTSCDMVGTWKDSGPGDIVLFKDETGPVAAFAQDVIAAIVKGVIGETKR